MKNLETERSAGEVTLAGDASPGGLDLAHMEKKQAPASIPAATVPKRSIAVRSQFDWPLPASNPDPMPVVVPAMPRRRARCDAGDTIRLAEGETEILAALQARCKQLGIKIKKADLLAVGLQLLADAPIGKLLAILGPHERSGFSLQRRKKKVPVRS